VLSVTEEPPLHAVNLKAGGRAGYREKPENHVIVQGAENLASDLPVDV
jgi:hypothetical protein